eukprot:TRINITY_DN5098_c0_g1_i1.p1 TRINITY_DN5098_c0_g1~~TRINITY_DN5098_c0_g1_i1.p1  ORF type:complete len:273 (+),score=57.33 TRINITY_DN5098_c0_g1_i1:79-897(+)
MVRSSGLAILLCAAGAAALLFAASAFVFPPVTGPHGTQNLRNAGEANQALSEKFIESQPATEPAAGEPSQAFSFLKWVGAGLLAGVMMSVTCSGPAHADLRYWQDQHGSFFDTFSVKNSRIMEPCKNSKRYAKRIKDDIYKISQKQKKYPKGGNVYNRLATKIEGIKRRQEAYGDRWCGKRDGLPRTIPTGEFTRGGIVIPAVAGLYSFGWIGWAGRSYLLRTNDMMKEIKLDVPLALTCMASGFAWPVLAWQEIVNGEMVLPDSMVRQKVN